jgi:hypothetical protein
LNSEKWGTKPTKFDTKRTILMSDIRWICSGPKSKSFKRRVVPSEGVCWLGFNHVMCCFLEMLTCFACGFVHGIEHGKCMSVVLKDRTIDVKFETVEDRDVWFLGLQHLVERSLIENGFRIISKGCLIMQRLVDRLRAKV